MSVSNVLPPIYRCRYGAAELSDGVTLQRNAIQCAYNSSRNMVTLEGTQCEKHAHLTTAHTQTCNVTSHFSHADDCHMAYRLKLPKYNNSDIATCLYLYYYKLSLISICFSNSLSYLCFRGNIALMMCYEWHYTGCC